MGESVFEVVKQSVTAREAAELYGIAVGRGGMACCPFHDDRHPSMKVDTRFHCFGCGADGDVIDFTARFYDLSPKEAAEKLAQDFGLSYDSKAPPRRSYVRQKSEAQVRKEKREHGWRVLTGYYHLLRKWEADYSPKTPDEAPHPRFLEAVQKKDYMGYLLDTFLDSSTEEQDQWIAEHTAEISAIERRVNIMADKPTNRERLQQITAGIEQGIKELFESEKYMRYLSAMSRFHRYSVNNTMLIYMQRPDATHVAGFNKWRDQFGRNVKKGEKGIKIIAPTPFKKKIEQQKLDPDTNLPLRDENGDIITEEKTVQIPMYKPVVVFDVQQTAGKPLPELAANLTGDVQNYGVFMEALRRSAPVPICFEKLAENMDGYFSVDKQRIAVREGMSEVQTVCAAVHEIAHSKLHNKDEIGEKYQAVELFGKPALFSNGRIDRDKLPEGLYAYDLRGSDYDPGLPVTIQEHVVVNHAATVIAAAPIELPEQGFLYLGEDGLNFTGGEQTVKEFWHAQYPEKAKLSRAAEEIQAESISFAVCAYYGIETGENSFGYLATWAKDRELTELRASLETINRTSSSLITDIDRHYAEICKERGLDKETESLAAQPVQEIAVQEPEPVTVPDNGCVPDPAISVESMNAYGYTDSNMLPLTKERALELMERDVSVYMLHTDNTEAMAFDAEEVRSFDGIFGVEASEWETVKDRLTPPDYEKAFLSNPADSFAIYQLRDNDNTAQLRFMNAEYLEKKGLSIEKENYAAVYAGGLDRRGDTQDRLDELYETFNIRRPEDFRGHSLSVSDIVALKQNGVVSCHYVDSWGFKALPDFLKPENYLKNAEMAMEDDYGMIDGVINNGPKQTVAELEEQAKSGKPVSLMELAQAARREQAQASRQEKKPSVLAKLCPPVNEPKKTARSKRAERELL